MSKEDDIVLRITKKQIDVKDIILNTGISGFLGQAFIHIGDLVDAVARTVRLRNKLPAKTSIEDGLTHAT
ncbi:MAG: hypothetical protein ACXV8P_09540 [Methylobacter sp.]